ncbi:hypothetical protein [Oceanibaculum sp.]|uniref:hypothetical protein n=1 Tax=Oceanibaculum sp. TaxID=1903597 RepID=UPI00258723E1|nr:hypothetical protein [Oceanibaculum sp.]MCH2395320.1 hypothetical protein [Oceanibaculum sp.]
MPVLPILSYLLLALGLSWLVALPFRLPTEWPTHLVAFSVEALIVLAALALVPALQSRRVRHLVAALVALTAILALGDLMIRLALNRPLNLALDLPLVRALYDLATGTFGLWGGLALLAGLGLIPLAAYGLTMLATRSVQRMARHRAVRAAALLLALTGGTVQILQAEKPEYFGTYWPASTSAGVTLASQWTQFRTLRTVEPAFRTAEAEDGLRDIPQGRLLAGLNGADVVLAFIESYGESALADPLYAPHIGARLEGFAATAKAAGLHTASGWLVSSITGGQSWLAHASVLSGLTIDSQQRYDLLTTGSRRTLERYFAKAGYRTVAFEPAITRPWPAGDFFGFDATLSAADMGYRGPAFGWKTMPDQFTLHRFEQTERRLPAGERPPVFAKFSLIDSHAPFAPLAPLVADWERLGDGALFHDLPPEGGEPDSLWQDTGRLRQAYAASLDRALEVLQSYAARHVDDRTVLILLGDHQPPGIIAGDTESQAVPIHVLSGDPALLAPFLDWGFRPGMTPAPDQPQPPMAAFRDFLVQGFSPQDDRRIARSGAAAVELDGARQSH